MSTDGQWMAVLVFAADLVIRVGLALRVIMRRLPVGVSLAWLMVILIAPFAGALAYLLFGELRLGRVRARRARRLHHVYESWLESLRHRYCAEDEARAAEQLPALARLIESATKIPPLGGNLLELSSGADAFFDRLLADIDGARDRVHLEFYIWAEGGRVEELAKSLERARGRGVDCRVLLDAVGSKAFLRGESVRRLRASGVEVTAALPVKLIRLLFQRFDLRLHRKLAVIDGEVGYTGSQNVADPRCFKTGAGVGEWVDAMVRVRGPAVEVLSVQGIEDWELETGVGLEAIVGDRAMKDQPKVGNSVVQVLPSGPNLEPDTLRGALLAAIYAARRELVLTTPYFVPEESMLLALGSAARRGVEVTLVVPARNDSKLVDLASRAFQGDLAEAGVRIMLFDAGLLHTKSITIDGEVSLFGSVNLDPRSMVLNFELTLAVYDREFTQYLRDLQEQYIEKSRRLDLDAWRARSWGRRLAENTARLVGPLL